LADPAHDTTLKIGGSSTAFTGEATTDLGADVYQIDATAKQVWDPAVTPTVTDFDGQRAARRAAFEARAGAYRRHGACDGPSESRMAS